MTDIRQYLPTKDSFKSWQVLLVLMAVLILGVGAVGYRGISRAPALPPDQTPSRSTPTPAETPLLLPSPSTASLIYGTWESGSTIKAINADGSNHITIAQLPSNIKDVNILSDSELLYIGETDDKDHGKKVNLYNLQTNQIRTLFEATPGFGIDDLVISPDKKWLATWEVRFALRAKVLSGGDSRVYTVNLASPQNKILVVDEQNVSATNFLRYPLFFDSQNRLFLDTFGPNSGGWNRGLWVVNTDSSNLAPVPAMADGEYSTDPTLSPDGTKIVFTGYDPNASPQIPPNPSSGILRPAIANPNLLQIMDLSNFQKTTLLGSANGAQYANPIWADNQEKIAFLQFKVSNANTSKYQGVYTYNLSSQTTTQILGAGDYPSVELLSLNQEKLFWGRPTENTGNLGQNYQSIFEGFLVTNLADATTSPIAIGPALQFINILGKTSGEASAFGAASLLVQPTPDLSLKLKSFEIKPLAQVRNPQQNDHPNTTRCRDLFGTDRANWDRSKCSDSPLYLYPEKEVLVTVKVNPPAQILYADPPYQEGWQVLAKPDGQLITAADSKTYNKISYNYLTPLNTPNSPKPPTSGLVVRKTDLGETLNIYALNLGLHDREVADFVSFWLESLPASPYWFISHFNREQSTAMMPLEINPKPDTLIQVIMYFKPLAKPVEADPPVFEDIPERKGFVAIDWSGMIDGS